MTASYADCVKGVSQLIPLFTKLLRHSLIPHFFSSQKSVDAPNFGHW